MRWKHVPKVEGKIYKLSWSQDSKTRFVIFRYTGEDEKVNALYKYRLHEEETACGYNSFTITHSDFAGNNIVEKVTEEDIKHYVSCVNVGRLVHTTCTGNKWEHIDKIDGALYALRWDDPLCTSFRHKDVRIFKYKSNASDMKYIVKNKHGKYCGYGENAISYGDGHTSIPLTPEDKAWYRESVKAGGLTNPFTNGVKWGDIEHLNKIYKLESNLGDKHFWLFNPYNKKGVLIPCVAMQYDKYTNFHTTISRFNDEHLVVDPTPDDLAWYTSSYHKQALTDPYADKVEPKWGDIKKQINKGLISPAEMRAKGQVASCKSTETFGSSPNSKLKIKRIQVKQR